MAKPGMSMAAGVSRSSFVEGGDFGGTLATGGSRVTPLPGSSAESRRRGPGGPKRTDGGASVGAAGVSAGGGGAAAGGGAGVSAGGGAPPSGEAGVGAGAPSPAGGAG